MEEGAIEMDAEAGLSTEVKLAVCDMFGRGDEVVAPRDFSPGVFEDTEFGKYRGDMGGSDGGNGATRVVESDVNTAADGGFGDEEELGEAATVLDVGHDAVPDAGLEITPEAFEAEDLFAADELDIGSAVA